MKGLCSGEKASASVKSYSIKGASKSCLGDGVRCLSRGLLHCMPAGMEQAELQSGEVFFCCSFWAMVPVPSYVKECKEFRNSSGRRV